MNFSAIFISRPVATTLLTIGIAFAGGLAFLRLSVALTPSSYKIMLKTYKVSASL